MTHSLIHRRERRSRVGFHVERGEQRASEVVIDLSQCGDSMEGVCDAGRRKLSLHQPLPEQAPHEKVASVVVVYDENGREEDGKRDRDGEEGRGEHEGGAQQRIVPLQEELRMALLD